MKKSNIVILALIMCFGVFGFAFGASSVPVTVNATVPNASPDMTIKILVLDRPSTDPWRDKIAEATTMDFGPLTHTLTDGTEAGVWYSRLYFAAFIYTNGFGHRYEIKSTCTGLTSGANFLPTGGFGLSPAYSVLDCWDPANCVATQQGARPGDSALGTAGSAVVTDKSIYRSGTDTAGGRIIQAYYSLPPDGAGGVDPFTGWTGVPLTQAPGTYSGTVTITIAVY